MMLPMVGVEEEWSLVSSKPSEAPWSDTTAGCHGVFGGVGASPELSLRDRFRTPTVFFGVTFPGFL